MYTLEQCRTVVRALRVGARLKKYNDYISLVGLTVLPTIHLADRLFDRQIDLKLFIDTFFELLDKHVLLLVAEFTHRDDAVKFSMNGLVFVFERGKIDTCHIILKTIYPLRPGKIVDFDAAIINELKEKITQSSLQLEALVIQ
jgi:hypothetical protein